MIEEAIRGRGYEIIEKERGGRFTFVYQAYQSAIGHESEYMVQVLELDWTILYLSLYHPSWQCVPQQ